MSVSGVGIEETRMVGQSLNLGSEETLIDADGVSTADVGALILEREAERDPR